MKKLTSLLVTLITVHSQLISVSFTPHPVDNLSKNGRPRLKVEEQKINLKWVVKPGKYKLVASTSSQDIMASLVITVE